MQALGLIETKGLLASIEAADAMLKAAEVSLVQKVKVGGGLITIVVTGDVAAVKAAVDAGAAAIQYLNAMALYGTHIIARPHEDIAAIVGEAPLVVAELPAPAVNEVEEELETDADFETTVVIARAIVDAQMVRDGWEATLTILTEMKVTELRLLAREYPEFNIAGREISKANKMMLIEEFTRFYQTDH